MPTFNKSFNIKKRDFVRAGEASIQVKNILKALDVQPQLIRRIAICCYEGEMNAVMHGGDGELSIAIDGKRLTIDIHDNGPGIADIEQAMQEGFSTASDDCREMGFGAGMGLPNMKKNADTIHIASDPGQGTHVHMTFALTP